tara:strand:- start:1377 stop:1646 length:270 start_codon:yes stop_codon:yes gene_type:complete
MVKKDYNSIFVKADRFWNGFFFFALLLSILLACITCSDEFHIGQAREDIARQMFETDSIMAQIMIQIDSTRLDFEKFYIEAQKINNGHE